jgi:CRISPR/Cas system endoribonuclease Cas6 (RAMP superfamily)
MPTRSLHVTTSELDRLLVESLDESFAAILGEIPKKTLFDFLEKNRAITKNRIPEKLNEFTTAMETVFGATASKVLESIVVKGLYSKLALTYIERPDWRLLDYMTEAKSRTTLFNHAVPAI